MSEKPPDEEKDLNPIGQGQESSNVVSLDRARGPYRRSSMSDLRAHMGTHMKKVSEGSPLVVTNRGKPIAIIDEYQKSLPLFGLPERQIGEFHDLVDGLESEDLALVIQFVRKILESKIAIQPESEKK
jgi:hypothetical protein